MCGIIGYVGDKQALPVIIGGLQRLEYRGYDSAGVAVIDDHNDMQLRRSVGKLSNLTNALDTEDHPLKGTIGMGHTRWATHGKPTENNAHPHRGPQNRVVVVHNGIIENYVKLKQDLARNGYDYRFSSETDTEVMPHLLEMHMQEEGLSLTESVIRLLGEIKGTAALVTICTNEPDKIVAARLSNAGAVVVGYGEAGEMFVASDIPAILPHTRRMTFLDHGEVAVITREGVKFLNMAGETITKEIITTNMDGISAAKGGYKHFMLKEIFEQPQSLTDTIRARIDVAKGEVNLENLNLTPADIAGIEKVTIVACGTSWHAGLVGKFLIEELARLSVEVDIASEFRYRDPILSPKHLLIAITQSGETVDTLAAMEEARLKKARLLSIANVVGSQAARVADGVIYIQAGPEIGVASTKTFTGTIADLVMLAVHLGRQRGTLSADRAQEILQGLVEVPKQVADILSNEKQYDKLARKLFNSRDFLFLGRGIHYPIALEGALKLKELSYIHAEGYPAGEMKHGPIALLDDGLPVVTIATQDKLYPKVLSAVEQAKARDAYVLAVVTEGDNEVSRKADEVITIPAADPLLTPILASIPMQLLSYYIAVRRGCDVDQPRNLAKSVTVE